MFEKAWAQSSSPVGWCLFVAFRLKNRTYSFDFISFTTVCTGFAALSSTTMSLIVALLSVSFALGAWSRAGLYCNHQDLSPRFASALLGISNTAGALPGILGVWSAGYLLDTTGSWAQSLFYPIAACQLFGLIVYSIFGSSKRQAWS